MLLTMVKTNGHLIPAGPVDKIAFDKIERDRPVEVRVTRPRNLRFHRLVWGLVHLCFEHQSQFATTGQLMDALKIATGYCDEISGLDGQPAIKVRSISFASMSEESFREFFDKLLEIVTNKIIPDVNRLEFEEQVYALIGEPGPLTLNPQQ